MLALCLSNSWKLFFFGLSYINLSVCLNVGANLLKFEVNKLRVANEEPLLSIHRSSHLGNGPLVKILKMDAPSMSGRCNLFLAQTDRAYRVVGDGSRDGLVGLMSSLDRPSIRFPSIYLYGWVGYCRGGVCYIWMIPRYWGSFGCFSLPVVVFLFVISVLCILCLIIYSSYRI